MTTTDRPDVTARVLLRRMIREWLDMDTNDPFDEEMAATPSGQELLRRADATRAADAEVAGLRADNERMTRELEAWNSIPRWSNQRLENAMTTSGHELVIDGSQFLCPTEPVWFEDWDTAARHIARVAVAALAAQPAAPEAEPGCADCGDRFGAAVHDELYDPEVSGYHPYRAPR